MITFLSVYNSSGPCKADRLGLGQFFCFGAFNGQISATTHRARISGNFSFFLLGLGIAKVLPEQAGLWRSLAQNHAAADEQRAQQGFRAGISTQVPGFRHGNVCWHALMDSSDIVHIKTLHPKRSCFVSMFF
jgi:hypothetical protein